MPDFYETIAKEIRTGKIRTRAQLERRKKQLCKWKSIQTVPSNAKIMEETGFKHRLLQTKPTRSLSGVSVVAIMTKPQPCPGECIYCPRGEAAQSYTGYEPAARRARRAGFDAVKQVRERLKQLSATGHPTSKIELIIMGATFTAMPASYQENFVLDAFNGLNDKQSPTLAEAIQTNETTSHRCVGLTFEVRPDYCREEHVNRMFSFGVTRVELGVQTIYDDVYEKVRRGHGVAEVEEATRLLKDSFLKVGYHLMPGLPFSSKERDLEMFHAVFEDARFKPDMLKIYPCILAKREFYEGKEIFELYESGEWEPLQAEEAARLIAEAKKYFPRWVRVMRIQRDVPIPQVEAGVKAGNLRELIRNELADKGVKCKCIRCREVRNQKVGQVELTREDYEASGGKEIFLSFEDLEKDLLVGFLRLREPGKPFRSEITPRTVGVRELHVYGPEADVGEDPGAKQQHRGYGQQLLREAERVAVEELDAKKLLITSGIGAREYYRRLGYELEGVYMAKVLKL